MITFSQLNEKLMVSVTDKILQQEKIVDQILLQLALVDLKGQSCVVNHILNSNMSFKLISQIIKMSSPNFLKPYQLQTVMSYAETQYHSNDYQFITIMADVLTVVKM
jgi:hypothetical protein